MFPGVREQIERLPAEWRPTIVGPLIRDLPPRSHAPRGTLVNLGGVRSRFIDPDHASMFLVCVARILRELEPLLPSGPIVVAAGSDARAVLAPLLPPRAVAVSLPQPEYLRALAGAELFLSAPGLNAIFEALHVGVPFVFLPPQNATQVLQLERYRAAGLVAPGLNLPDLVAALELPERVDDEGAYTARVLDALRAVVASEERMLSLVRHVAVQLRELDARATARHGFRASLGLPGGAIIADDIRRYWEAHAR